jgi:hypothetical protein
MRPGDPPPLASVHRPGAQRTPDPCAPEGLDAPGGLGVAAGRGWCAEGALDDGEPDEAAEA